ncbi:MAG: hypothetical protein GY937_12630 [bacterium]|nr:hypothetical protein [bacterium]
MSTESGQTQNASAFILVHNHPSGDPSPSAEDRVVTKRLSEAGELLSIKLLDHVIVVASAFYSFSEEGLLPAKEEA